MADQYPLARFGGLGGPFIEKGLQVIHAREVAKESLGSFKRGGKVKKTGMYKLHKGETVIPHGANGNKVRKGSAAMTEVGKDW